MFGGWASGSSVARHGDVRFSLQMRFYVNGAWVVGEEMHYNEDVTDWQFGCAAVKAPDAYTKVRLYARYPNNGNSARFTNLFVNRDAFNESYCMKAVLIR